MSHQKKKLYPPLSNRCPLQGKNIFYRKAHAPLNKYPWALSNKKYPSTIPHQKKKSHLPLPNRCFLQAKNIFYRNPPQ